MVSFFFVVHDQVLAARGDVDVHPVGLADVAAPAHADRPLLDQLAVGPNARKIRLTMISYDRSHPPVSDEKPSA